MPEHRAHDELEYTKPAQQTMPVWAPNPGVPTIARILAYTFGGLMLLTLFATCLTPRADDSPPIPKTEQDWAALKTHNGCVLYYPRGWAVEQETIDNRVQVNCALIPGSPVQVMILLQETSEHDGFLAVGQIRSQLEKMLPERLDDFTLSDKTLTIISSNGQAFTFTDRGKPMSGAWVIEPRGRFVLCVMGQAPRSSWRQTELIVSQMAKKAQCLK